jgi:hypothetical protein
MRSVGKRLLSVRSRLRSLTAAAGQSSLLSSLQLVQVPIELFVPLTHSIVAGRYFDLLIWLDQVPGRISFRRAQLSDELLKAP